MALKDPAFWLVDIRSVKTRIRTVVRIFRIRTSFLQNNFFREILHVLTLKNLNNSLKILSDKEKTTDNEHKIPKRYGKDLKLKFCRVWLNILKNSSIILCKIPRGIVLQTHLQSSSLHACTTRNKLECFGSWLCTLPWTCIMHVCF